MWTQALCRESSWVGCVAGARRRIVCGTVTRSPLFAADLVLLPEARHIVHALRAAGHQALFAGGCVRDALLQRPVKDIDLATSATPDEIEALFPGRTTAVGKAFGVIVVRVGEAHFEVASFRGDGPYADGRRPASIRFTDAAEDAQRRDFTINGLFYDPVADQVLDFVGGRDDLQARCLRTIGDAQRRFEEDRLRLLRAARFAAVLDFCIAPDTAAAVRRFAPRILEVSAERIGSELTRLLTEAPRPAEAVALLQELGLLAPLLPEVAAMRGVPQPPQYHPEGDVWTHTLMMLARLPPPPRDPALTYAVLLHDVGKPLTTVRQAQPDGGERIRSPNHAAVGADLAEAILLRLKLPLKLAADVAAVVRRHMTFSELPRMRPATLRRFLGAPTFPLDLALHRLDVACSSGDESLLNFVAAQQAALAAETALPEPWVRGRDLLALGLPPGPLVGHWLERAYDWQLERSVPDREALLARLRAEL